jgi:arylsulfatase A-like enzyme
VVSNLDTLPSVLDLVGLGAPENLRVAGRSFAPLLRPGGGAGAAWDDTLYGQYDMHHGAVARMRMIRTPGWKLVRHFEPGGSDELYDLAADPGETRDLASSPAHRERLVELDRRLARWMASIADPLADSGRGR